MGYSNYNPNPAGRSVGDCAVRAVALATGGYLIRHGFSRHVMPDDAPDGYTVAEFARDHPSGMFVLSMPGRHVVTVVDGDYYDSWDSGAEVPVYYYAKE